LTAGGRRPFGDRTFAVVREGFLGVEGKAFLFDVDGVLLDVRGSFRAVVCDAANRYLGEAGLGVWETRPFRPEDVRKFKDAGGFGRDWDVAIGAAEFFLWKSKAQGLTEGLELRDKPPLLSDFLRKVGARGGGLGGLREELGPGRVPVDVPMLEQWCRQLYAGPELCERLYGFRAESWVLRGAVEEEFPLLGRRGRALLDGKAVGLLTGRTPEEARLAVERLGLEGKVRCVVSDDGVVPRKPDPASLDAALRSLGEAGGFFFGDTLDDLRTVLRYNERADRHAVASVLCAGGEGSGDPSEAIALGWDVVVPGVDDGIACALAM
jgi:phosphoglycolate phosphatase-like HAD superfamily hydrolase